MEVKEAVMVAKRHIRDLFETEGIRNVGLEEVERDDGVWLITIGFSRPWDFESHNLFGMAQAPPRRTYKVVRVGDTDGKIMSVISHAADIQSTRMR